MTLPCMLQEYYPERVDDLLVGDSEADIEAPASSTVGTPNTQPRGA